MIRRTFPILALSIFSSMLGSGIVVPLLPLFAESLGASGLWLGMIFAGFPASRTLFTPLFGRLSDRRGRKLFICTGLFAYAVISFAFVWAGDVYQLFIIRLVHGVSGAMILPIAQAYVGDISPVGEEGKWMGYANAAFFSGYGFGPLMGGLVTEQLGMNIAFIAMGALNMIAFFIALIFLPEVTGKKTAEAPRLSFGEMRRSRTMTGLFSFRLALTLGRSSFFAFLPVFAALTLGLKANIIGIIMAIHILLMALLGIPGGRIADVFSRRALVVLGALVSLVYLALIPQSATLWPLLGLVVLGSVGNALAVPAASAIAVEEGRKYGMGSTLAAFNVAMSIGMAVGPILSGAIVDFTDINAAFYFAAAAVLVGAGLFTWLTRPERRGHTVTR
jgi:DHA1 family multidrug resistance protein-like MFS transporter